MKVKRQQFILEDHMELIPEQPIARKRTRSKKRKATQRVKRLYGTVTFKAVQTEKYLVESFLYKKEGIKITRLYAKNADISDWTDTRHINKFLKQKIEVVNA